MVVDIKCKHLQQEVRREEGTMTQKCLICRAIVAIWAAKTGRILFDVANDLGAKNSY